MDRTAPHDGAWSHKGPEGLEAACEAMAKTARYLCQDFYVCRSGYSFNLQVGVLY
jgi:hypothetical protein